ncbi:MAG: L,D-transpeptidase [Candidatus Pacebacteria bacterium]|nr:L,D-transpeptidase [Candidatus Paceibacterota bacterium]
MKQKRFFLSGLFLTITIVTLIFFIKSKTPCANSISCIDNLSTVIENGTQGTFLGNLINVPPIILDSEFQSEVLGEDTEDEETVSEKHIYVDLSQQKLYAYEGNEIVLDAPVSTGKWGRTPTGEFSIWIKIRATKMSGGSGNDYYYLPNVPYVMYFYNDQIPKARGYGLHGTYWHNNFGHEMSHGCVNLRTTDAGILYNWTNPTTIRTTTYASKDDPGTPISICKHLQIQDGTTPICINSDEDKTIISNSPEIKVIKTSQDSPEGAIELFVDTEKMPFNRIKYTLSVQEKDSEIQEIFSETINNKMTIELPLNSWSPQNKYFFIKQNNVSSKNNLIFKSSGEKFDEDDFININDLYIEHEIPYTFNEVTGWADPNLLLITTTQLDSDKEGPSYWFDVTNQNFIQLFTRF